MLNVAYGIKSPVKAIFPMSPSVYGFDFKKTLDSPELPAMLVVMSQNDLEPMYETVPGLLEVASNAGLDYSFTWVPGFGHFYPAGAVSLGDDGSRMSVGERVIQFLDKHLKN